MSKTRPLAPPEEVDAQIQRILRLHADGKKIRRQHFLSIEEHANRLGWNETKVRKARQFANPTSGYDQDQLDELCDLLVEHRPLFATAHIGVLVTVPEEDRDHLQYLCITQNWSVNKLKLEIKKLYGVRGKGGRRRQVGPGDILIRLRDETTRWARLINAAKKGQHGQPPALPQLSDRVRFQIAVVTREMSRLGKMVVD